MTAFNFESVDLSAVDAWLSAARARTLTDVGAHNAMVASLLLSRDVLADPAGVFPPRTSGAPGLGSAGKSLRLPMVPYAGSDPGLRGRSVPLVGAVPIPAHWRSKAPVPADAPAWVRASDTERRELYGAVSSLLEELRRDAVLNPQAGATGTGTGGSGFAWAPVAVGVGIGVFAVFAVDRWMISRERIASSAAAGETDRARVRETAETQRYGMLLAAKLEAAKARYDVAARTGVLPPPTPLETALGAQDVPRAGERPTSQRAATFWEAYGSLTLAGAGGAALLGLALVAGRALRPHVAEAWGRARQRFGNNGRMALAGGV